MYKIDISAARHNAHLTQGEAAEKLGINLYTLLNYEKGKYYPPVKVLRKMCEVYRDKEGNPLPFQMLDI